MHMCVYVYTCMNIYVSLRLFISYKSYMASPLGMESSEHKKVLTATLLN